MQKYLFFKGLKSNYEYILFFNRIYVGFYSVKEL